MSGNEAIVLWAKLRAAVDEIKSLPIIIINMQGVNFRSDVSEVLQRASSIVAENWFNQKKREFKDEDFSSFFNKVAPIETKSLNVLSASEFNPSSFYSAGINISQREVQIALLPTTQPWEVPAYFEFGGWNSNPKPEDHVALFKHWHFLYGSEIVALSHDTMDVYVNRPPTDLNKCLSLANEYYLYCPDMIEYEGAETLRNFANGLSNANVWYFWWD